MTEGCWGENMDYFPNRTLKKDMYDFIGTDDLFSDIPDKFLLKGSENSSPMTELETKRHIEKILSKNIGMTSFKGGGAYDHYVPAHVSSITSRNEFYTSYTPYQPEISQGILQSMYEYQSLMAEIVSLPIVNASMYDWSSALGEAALMSARVTKRYEFIIPEIISPERRSVLEAYTENVGIKILECPNDKVTGQLDLVALEGLMSERCSGVYIENPSYFGIFEEQAKDISSIAHEHGALFIVGTDPLSCGIVKGPGEYGADIVIGEAAHLGNAINFGGPLLGLFAVSNDRKLLRTMPGRVVGITNDSDGIKGYVMTLQTREQHIRRDKATSNICTNESLCAVACAAYIASLGKKGFVKLSRSLFSNASYAYNRIGGLDGYTAPLYKSVHFREFVVRHPLPIRDVEAALNSNNISGGIPIDERSSIYCITDKHTKEDIDGLINALGAI